MSTSMAPDALLESLLSVRADAQALEERRASDLADLADDRRVSAINLLHYTAVRNIDLRAEQRVLARLGLSSLGRAEAHILATLDAVIRRLLADPEIGDADRIPPDLLDDLGTRGPDAVRGRVLLEAHTAAALGPLPDGAPSRIMVTLPTEAATDPELVDRLVSAGMTVARINCAHDGPDAWQRMAAHVRTAAERHERPVRVAFDLAGPKLRTGGLAPGPDVHRLKPERDELGRVVRPTRIRFVSEGGSDTSTEIPQLAADVAVVSNAEPGDRIRFVDARGRKRRLEVVSSIGPIVEAIGDRTSYLVSGTVLELVREGSVVTSGPLGDVPATPMRIALASGDLLELRAGGGLGHPSGDGREAHVHVDIPELYRSIEVGHRVLLDDGAIVGIVVDVRPDTITVRIDRGGRLKPEKGINLPDTDLALAALDDDDLAALDAVAPLADLVSLSFVSRPSDIDHLAEELAARGRPDVGVILKIEHRTAFEHLPALLLRALALPSAAVMVARGDLAVEVGYERLAEVQEEILLLCEAAHVPVIWATQVLESLAKEGAPTRAEITDAAAASRCECVMLNKGPHIPDTIETLSDIIGRMHSHLDKRSPMLRRLSVVGRHAD